jgi:hypothetical protein
MFTLILVLRFDVSTEAVRRRDGIFRCWSIRVVFDEDDNAEHDEGHGDEEKGEHEVGRTFEWRLLREKLWRRPSRRRTARRLTMDVSDPIPKKARKKITQRTENNHRQETSIPCQPLSQRNTLIDSRDIPLDSCHDFDLQYYAHDKSWDEDMPEWLEIPVCADREANARDRLDVDLKSESEYGEGSCMRGRRQEVFVVLVSRRWRGTRCGLRGWIQVSEWNHVDEKPNHTLNRRKSHGIGRVDPQSESTTKRYRWAAGGGGDRNTHNPSGKPLGREPAIIPKLPVR